MKESPAQPNATAAKPETQTHAANCRLLTESLNRNLNERKKRKRKKRFTSKNSFHEVEILAPMCSSRAHRIKAGWLFPTEFRISRFKTLTTTFKQNTERTRSTKLQAILKCSQPLPLERALRGRRRCRKCHGAFFPSTTD